VAIYIHRWQQAARKIYSAETPKLTRYHQTIRVTPAMEAGIADHVWTIEEIVCLLE
jgi:hypothetical protein